MSAGNGDAAATTGAPPPPPTAAAGPPRSTALLDRLEASASASAQQAAAVARATEIREARRSFNSLLEMQVLDEKHFGCDQLLAALDVLRRVVGNILDAPSEPKFRRVKLSSKAWEGRVAPLGPDAEKLLHMVGFRRRTVDMEAALVFEYDAAGAAAASGGNGGVSSSNKNGEREWQLLAMSREVLGNAAESMAAKAARAAQAKAERSNRAAAEREKLRLALSDDQALRREEYEARRRTGPAVSQWQPGQRQSEEAAAAAAAAGAGAGAGGGGGLGAEEGALGAEDEEEDDE